MKYSIITLLLASMSFLSHGITYYISTTGNDANSGRSTTTPWKTISKVNSKSFVGDTILFQGSYTFYGSLHFENTDVGTSTKPIVVGSYGTGKAKISSDSSFGIYIYNAAGIVIKNLIFAGSGRFTNKKPGVSFYMDKPYTFLSFIRIDNLEVYGYREAGISIGSWASKAGYKDISITNCSVHDNGMAGISTYAMDPYTHRNVTLRYNKTYNNTGLPDLTTTNTGNGIKLGGVDIALVEYCTSYNNGLDNKNTGGGPVGIWAWASDSVTLQYNESHDNKTGTLKDGGGFDFDGGCTNSTMQYNYSHNNYGSGYLLANYTGALAMKNITIRYNISENDGRRGDQGSINLWSSASSGGIQNVNIYNNTIFVTPITIPNATSRGFYIKAGPITGVKFRNNIIQATGSIPLVDAHENTGACVLQGNDYWTYGGNFKIIWGTIAYGSLSAWRTATNQEMINGAPSGYQIDAQFADTTTGITFNDPTKLTTLKRYKLKSTSGLINKGLNLNALFGTNVGTRDYWGNSLVSKTTFHVGAFQGTPISTTTALSEITLLNTGSGSDLALNRPQEDRLKEYSLEVLSGGNGQNDLVINYSSAKQGRATIALINLQGQVISYIFSGQVNAGDNKQFRIGTTNLPNGIYLISAQVGGDVITKKVLISK